jgi:hypothetical protein
MNIDPESADALYAELRSINYEVERLARRINKCAIRMIAAEPTVPNVTVENRTGNDGNEAAAGFD